MGEQPLLGGELRRESASAPRGIAEHLQDFDAELSRQIEERRARSQARSIDPAAPLPNQRRGRGSGLGEVVMAMRAAGQALAACEIAERIEGMGPDSAARRLRELRRAGMVEPASSCAFTPAGRRNARYRLTAKGWMAR